MTLSGQICDTIASLQWDDLPASTRRAACHVLLDASGVILGASGLSEEVRPFLALARTSGSGPSTVMGTAIRVPPAAAALAGGAMSHALDYEDAFDIRPGHPNASLVPALIALAQSEGPIDGRRFLTALAAGCDFACRIGVAQRQAMEVGGWYPPPIVAGLGAAVGAAKLLGLDGSGIRDALSLALCQITMPGEIKHSPGTVIRAVRESFPAQAAVTSALLAREGVAGFEQPLEGKDGFFALYAGGKFDSADLTFGLGSRFWIDHLTFKAWPSCRGTHPFIELVLDLREQHSLDPARIARITVTCDEIQRMLVEPAARKQAPAVLIDAKFSVQFCTALALVRGKVDLDSFTPAALADPAVLAVAARIEAQVEPASTRHPGSGGAIEIVMDDGTNYQAEVHNARGCPENPLSEAELVTKFVDCAARAQVPPKHSARLAEAVLALADCEDVGALFA